MQFRTGFRWFHYEIQIFKRERRIEAGLDVEPVTGNRRLDRKLKDSFMGVAIRKIRGRRGLLDLKVKRNWIRQGTWGRICYEFSFDVLDSDLAETVARRLDTVRRLLGPTVRSWSSSTQN